MADRASPATHTVLFQPSGARGTVETGISIRQAAARLGVDIESICAENATCGKCRVLIEDDTRAKVHSAQDHASPMGESERAWIAKRADIFRRAGIDVGRMRLSCQAKVEGDLVVFVPESSRGSRQIIRKAATDRHIELDPVIRRYYLELTPPDLANPKGDLERIAEGLVGAMSKVRASEKGWEPPAPKDLWFDFSVIHTMGDALRNGDWKVSVTVREDREIIDVRPGYHEKMYGIAIDVGSTSIAVYLSDLTTGAVIGSDSIMNPQTAYGDDIMSRMAYEKEHEDGLATLRSAVLGGLDQVLKRVLRSSGVDPINVFGLTVVGNTTMHHILLGISTRNLSRVPFVPALHRALDIKARDLGLPAHPAANVHVLPIAASFVGADAMAVVIAEEPHKQDEQLLIIDIGTNAELIAGNRQRLICTSTPTGPAFEGAHIEHGMRAAEGALEKIDIDPETLEAHYAVIGGGAARGLAGSAIIDGVAEMFRVGIITPRGHFAPGIDNPRVRKGDLGWEYVVVWGDETSHGRDITITLDDVRQIQLAKAALYTAAHILLKELGITTPDKIILAGAFGSHIDTTKAMILGMIPDCPLERVYSVGNAAGDGARIALLNGKKRLEAQHIARTIQRIELPVDPDFQNEYMAAMNFPHMDQHFEALEGLLPDYGPDPLAARLRGSS